MTTARRVAWELEHGPLPPGARVGGCAVEPACVRIEHLRLSAGKRVESTKTRVERDVALDTATLEMLERHCERHE